MDHTDPRSTHYLGTAPPAETDSGERAEQYVCHSTNYPGTIAAGFTGCYSTNRTLARDPDVARERAIASANAYASGGDDDYFLAGNARTREVRPGSRVVAVIGRPPIDLWRRVLRVVQRLRCVWFHRAHTDQCDDFTSARPAEPVRSGRRDHRDYWW